VPSNINFISAKTMPSSILFHEDWNSPLIGIDSNSIDELSYPLNNIITGVKSYLCGEKCFGKDLNMQIVNSCFNSLLISKMKSHAQKLMATLKG